MVSPEVIFLSPHEHAHIWAMCTSTKLHRFTYKHAYACNTYIHIQAYKIIFKKIIVLKILCRLCIIRTHCHLFCGNNTSNANCFKNHIIKGQISVVVRRTGSREMSNNESNLKCPEQAQPAFVQQCLLGTPMASGIVHVKISSERKGKPRYFAVIQ